MLRSEMLIDPGRKFPFVGRREELKTLLLEINKGTRSRWLITGEPGIGKTRLMHEVGLRFEDECRFFNLRGAGGPGEEPFELAPELTKGSPHERLLIFDDVDAVAPTDLHVASRILSDIATAPVFMTARTEDIWIEWERFAPITNRMQLRRLSNEEIKELLAAENILLSFADFAARHPGQSLDNPASLLEYLDALTFLEADVEFETILTPDGEPLRSGAGLQKVECSVRDVNDLLIAELATRPELMHELSPRKFEELVAALYSRSGFEVELTRASKDGGVDIYAVQRAPFGSFLTVVDCKRHRADRPVQVGLVRKLYGTVAETGASVGVIATTSYFTKGAKEFQSHRRHRIGLQDFVSLKGLLSTSQ